MMNFLSSLQTCISPPHGILGNIGWSYMCPKPQMKGKKSLYSQKEQRKHHHRHQWRIIWERKMGTESIWKILSMNDGCCLLMKPSITQSESQRAQGGNSFFKRLRREKGGEREERITVGVIFNSLVPVKIGGKVIFSPASLHVALKCRLLVLTAVNYASQYTNDDACKSPQLTALFI